MVAVVGKSWDLHVRDVLRVPLEENLAMITDSVRYLKAKDLEMIFDAEHFFDGYRHNPRYALRTLQAAREAGADTIVLCDTNGGSLPSHVAVATAQVVMEIGGRVGFHGHNDSGMAVANSVSAVRRAPRTSRARSTAWVSGPATPTFARWSRISS